MLKRATEGGKSVELSIAGQLTLLKPLQKEVVLTGTIPKERREYGIVDD